MIITWREKRYIPSFQFYEYFKINSVTKGIIQYIEELKKVENPDTYYAEQLYHAIKCLEHWWD
jgi:hypothetical protein